MSGTLSILFVCTANVSRSPYAHYRTLEIFGDQLACASAGIPGTDGRVMDPAMEAELPFEDGDALAHRSRRVTSDVLAASDLVLTMEFAHHMRLLDQWPQANDRVAGLRQFVDALARSAPSGTPAERVSQARAALAPNGMRWDVVDPYGRGSRAARVCARELDGLVLQLGESLGYEPIAQH